MPRKPKVFTTSIGFYDLAIAAPSMKAALEAWGAHSNLFQQNFAREVHDAGTVEVATNHPDVVLKRPVGSNKPFAETSELPDDLVPDARTSNADRSARPAPSKKRASVTTLKTKSRDASAAYEREEKKRQVRQRREQEKLAAARERRDVAVAKAEATIAAAEADHRARLTATSKGRAELDKREAAETDRWDAIREKLQQALQRAEEGS